MEPNREIADCSRTDVELEDDKIISIGQPETLRFQTCKTKFAHMSGQMFRAKSGLTSVRPSRRKTHAKSVMVTDSIMYHHQEASMDIEPRVSSITTVEAKLQTKLMSLSQICKDVLNCVMIIYLYVVVQITQTDQKGALCYQL